MPKISTIALKVCGDKMRYRNRKFRSCPALTILEIIIALAIITIIFAAVLPQFRVIQNGWDSRQAGTEVLQNGRVLIDHLNRNLSKAVKITTVSNPTETNGYIQFLGNDSNTYRYDINSTGSYVRYGRVGYTPSDLAGPVSSLTFTCYDSNNFTNAITDVNSIRFVSVQTILPNPAALGPDKTFTASIYLRTNADNGGIVGCWKLDETSGTTAADSSGKGHNGTLVNMTPPGCWIPGQIGNALSFDGTNDYVDLGTDSSLNFGSSEPFTVAAWVKTTENYGMIVSFRSSTDGGPVIDLAVGYEGRADDPGKAMILVRQDGGSGGYANVKGGAVNDGQWHHMAAVRSSDGTVELFLDGVSQGTNSGAESGGAITTDLRAIGSERRWVSDIFGTADQRYLVGTIDDVRVYNRALGVAEIATLANILTYRGFSEGKAPSDSNTTIVIQKPSGTAQNDLLITAVATDGDTSGSLSPPSGWTSINCGVNGTEVTLGAWRKIAGASEPASYNFSWTGGQKAYGWIMRFTGHNSTNPINGTPATANQTSMTPTSPAVTTTVPNCLILRLGAFDDTSVAQDNPNLLSGHTTITADSSGSSDSPTYQAAGTAQSGTGAITVPWPAHQAGDIALLFVESCGGQAATLSTPAGFANVTNSPQATGAGTAGTRITVFWCRATSSSMSSPTVADPGNHVYGRILTFRSVVATGNPWDVTAGGTKATASTTTTFGTVTTSVNNDLIVLAASRDNDSTAAAWSNWTNANLSSLTERSDEGTTSGNGGGVGVATGVKSTAGSTGSTTATVTSSVDGHMTIALKPAGDGTVSGGAGYVRQASSGNSGTSNFALTSSSASRMLTIAIAPAGNSGYDCCGDYIQP